MLTLAEAAAWLDPPLSYGQLAEIVHALPGLRPAGNRPTGRGRPVYTYDAGELMELHSRIRPWLLWPARPRRACHLPFP